MKIKRTTAFLLTLYALIAIENALAFDVPLDTTAHVYFSPNGGCTEAIVFELDKAKTEVLVQAYSFTSKKIAKALVNAHKQGVDEKIILDKCNMSGEYSAGDFMAHMGIPTFIDA